LELVARALAEFNTMAQRLEDFFHLALLGFLMLFIR